MLAVIYAQTQRGDTDVHEFISFLFKLRLKSSNSRTREAAAVGAEGKRWGGVTPRLYIGTTAALNEGFTSHK